jgi:hypothetical protein
VSAEPGGAKVVNPQAFAIEGILLRGSSGGLELIVGHYILEFAREDVLEVVELVVPKGVTMNDCCLVRAELAGRACLLSVRPLDPERHRLAVGEIPFSLAVRQRMAQGFDSPRFKALERVFLEERNL